MIKELIKAKMAVSIASIAALAICLSILLANPFHWNFLPFNRQLTIDKTENVVEKIRKIAEFSSANYYEEIVIKESRVYQSRVGKALNWMHLGNDSTKEELVIIGKGRLRAGFNLESLKDEDIKVDVDTLYITLPKVEIFDVIINPSDCENFVEEGKWTHEEVVALQLQAKEQIKQNAIEYGILTMAEKHGKEKLSALFRNLGFSKVIIQDKDAIINNQD